MIRNFTEKEYRSLVVDLVEKIKLKEKQIERYKATEFEGLGWINREYHEEWLANLESELTGMKYLKEIYEDEYIKTYLKETEEN